jgi:Helix-turn-helix domain
MRGPKTAGERLRDAREASDLQLDDLAYLVRHRLPRERFSRELLRQMETGDKPPSKWRLPVVAVLCDELRISPYDRDVAVADDLQTLRSVLRGGNDDDDNGAHGSTVTSRLSRKRSRGLAVPALA